MVGARYARGVKTTERYRRFVAIPTKYPICNSTIDGGARALRAVKRSNVVATAEILSYFNQLPASLFDLPTGGRSSAPPIWEAAE
jgi:hypothetical protein